MKRRDSLPVLLAPLVLVLAQSCSNPPDSSKRNLSQNDREMKIPEKGQNLIRTDHKESEFFEPTETQRVASESGTISLAAVENASGTNARTALDSVSGTPLLLSGHLPLNLVDKISGAVDAAGLHRLAGSSLESQTKFAAQLEALVKSFVQENAGQFSFKPELLKLNMEQFFVDDESILLGFDYQIGDYKLMGGHVGFRFSKGQLVQVISRTFGFTEEQLEKVESVDQKALAETTAAVVLGEGSLVEEASFSKVIFPRIVKSGDSEKYEFNAGVAFKATDKNGEPYALVRSLKDNEVLEWKNLKFDSSGKVTATVNQRTAGGALVEVSLPFISVKTDQASGFADALGQFSINGTQGSSVLDSAAFKIVNAKGQQAKVSGTGDLKFVDGNSTLAERNVFYHLQKVHAWAKEVINPNWFSTKVTANVNLAETCNAYWDGRSLNFMSESNQCRNTGEIADVVYHEWGHGLDNSIGGITDGAYSEGIGDIVATFLTKSPEMAPGFQKGGARNGSIRYLDSTVSYPSKSKEVHTEGEIIGATWYHLIQNFEKRYPADGRAMAKKIFLKSLYTTNQYEDSYEATLALDAGGGDPAKGKNFCLITDAFARHGLAKRSTKCNGMEEPATTPAPTPTPGPTPGPTPAPSPGPTPGPTPAPTPTPGTAKITWLTSGFIDSMQLDWFGANAKIKLNLANTSGQSVEACIFRITANRLSGGRVVSRKENIILKDQPLSLPTGKQASVTTQIQLPYGSTAQNLEILLSANCSGQPVPVVEKN